MQEVMEKELERGSLHLGVEISTLPVYLLTKVRILVSKNVPTMLCSWENGEQISEQTATLN